MRSLSKKSALVVLLSGMLASAVLPGCGEDSATIRLREITDKLTILTAAGQQLTVVEARRFATMRELRDQLDALSKEPSVPVATIKLLQARLNEQMAYVVSALAAEREQTASNLVNRILQSADTYQRQTASAKAMLAASLATEVSELAKERDELNKQAGQIEESHRRLAAQISKMQADSAALEAQVKTLRQEAASIRAANTPSATAALAAVERASQVSRRADELDRQTSYLTAEIARLAPEAASLAAQAAGLREAAGKVKASADMLADRESKIKADGQAIAASAAATGQEVAKLADELMVILGGGEGASLRQRFEQVKAGASQETDGLREAVKDATLPAIVAAAEGYFDAASKSAKQLGGDASNEQRKASQTTDLSIQQGLTDLRLLKARSQGVYQSAMAAVAALEPALPKQAAYQAEAKTAGEESGKAMTEVRAAYGEIREKVTGLNVPGSEKRLERIAAGLDKLAKGQTLPPPPPKPVASAAASGDGKSAPATANAAEAEAACRAIMEQVLPVMAKGDLVGWVKMTTFKNDREKSTMEIIAGVGQSLLALDEACKAKFKKGFSEIAAANPMLAQGVGQFASITDGVKKAKGYKLEQFKFSMSGKDKAKLEIPGDKESSTEFGIVGGKWVMLAGSEAADPQMMAMAPMLAPMAKAFDALTADVNAGKFADEKAFLAAMGKKMQEALMGGMK